MEVYDHGGSCFHRPRLGVQSFLRKHLREGEKVQEQLDEEDGSRQKRRCLQLLPGSHVQQQA